MHPHSRKRQDFPDAKSQGAVASKKVSQNFERLFCIHYLHSFSSLILFAHYLHSLSSLTLFIYYLHLLSSLILFTYSFHVLFSRIPHALSPPKPLFGGQVGKSAVLSTQTAFLVDKLNTASIIQSMNMLNCFHSFPRLFRRIHVFSASGCLSC